MGVLNPWKDKGDGGEGSPHFGTKALRWFRVALQQALRDPAVIPDAGLRRYLEPRMSEIVDWYAEYAEVYVEWRAHSEYHGERYSWGAWYLLTPEILSDLTDGMQEVQNATVARETSRFHSLDEWLAADLADTLPMAAHGGSFRLPADLKQTLRWQAKVRAMRCYRACKECGESFEPPRVNSVRCKSCVSAGKGAKGEAEAPRKR